MASVAAVLDNNSGITRRYGSGLVAVFVGATSGIGESTARAFIRNTDASRAYLIGRDETRAMHIIKELHQIKPESQVTFIKSDVSLLREVDDACSAIQQKEDKVNILFLSPGVGTTNGRDETDEGLDRKLNLHYYSRMRFVTNLLPQLMKAGDSSEHGLPLSRVVSVLEAGGEAALQLDDLSLKTHYSLRNCAKHAITMNSVSMEHLAASYPQISFIHSFPGVVKTRLDRNFSTATKYAITALMVLARPWVTDLNESGERHLYAASSPRFPPQKYKDGIPDAAEGSDGHPGSGFYRLSSTGSTYKPSKIMEVYRAEGVRSSIWQHTLDVFAKVRGAPDVEP
ncbi:short-chain dehydrogenase/reductase [Aspergillus pseudonomiae]|uniref:Short-chain dehydrogenase/reductase n=1 Tax=Aspergillus pseudonomiae TaxID=1506151 RepID=A0A5N7D0I8_9EURO|nr:short-chain dehydrogenase/reductase [Aspergillus pseudonomiae]KAB8261935.1 short-chain dehydrogenase/reductase [Aspergillus pseudonomiae]KAE8399941.1 short-chain dehydrogenase/reductase [Aspergillus pseudonomiae]